MFGDPISDSFGAGDNVVRRGLAYKFGYAVKAPKDMLGTDWQSEMRRAAIRVKAASEMTAASGDAPTATGASGFATFNRMMVDFMADLERQRKALFEDPSYALSPQQLMATAGELLGPAPSRKVAGMEDINPHQGIAGLAMAITQLFQGNGAGALRSLSAPIQEAQGRIDQRFQTDAQAYSDRSKLAGTVMELQARDVMGRRSDAVRMLNDQGDLMGKLNATMMTYQKAVDDNDTKSIEQAREDTRKIFEKTAGDNGKKAKERLAALDAIAPALVRTGLMDEAAIKTYREGITKSIQEENAATLHKNALTAESRAATYKGMADNALNLGLKRIGLDYLKSNRDYALSKKRNEILDKQATAMIGYRTGLLGLKNRELTIKSALIDGQVANYFSQIDARAAKGENETAQTMLDGMALLQKRYSSAADIHVALTKEIDRLTAILGSKTQKGANKANIEAQITSLKANRDSVMRDMATYTGDLDNMQSVIEEGGDADIEDLFRENSNKGAWYQEVMKRFGLTQGMTGPKG
jgi:hypothetical protein